LAKGLIAKGHEVVAVSQRPSTRSASLKFPSNSLQAISWHDVLSQQVISESTYIGWRQSPQSQPLGVDLIDWVKSASLRTGKIHHLSSASVYTGHKVQFSEKDYDPVTDNKLVNLKQALEKLVVNLSQEKECKFDLRMHESSDEILNLSTGRGVAVSEIIAHLKDLGINGLKLLEKESPENIMPRSVLSCKKLEETITWKPRMIEENMPRLVQELI
jgi:hypothetical protein